MTVHFREATPSDIGYMVALLGIMFRESPYNNPGIDMHRASYSLGRLLHEAKKDPSRVFLYVLDKGEPDLTQPLSALVCAERQPSYWMDADTVIEHFVYAVPGVRGSVALGRLLNTFKTWVTGKPGIVRLHAEHGVCDDEACQVFAKLGFAPRGRIYGMEVGFGPS